MKYPTAMIVEEHRTHGPPDEPNGAFVFRRGNANIRVVASNGLGWDHVSVSLATRCPTWEEMSWVKSLFFQETEVAMQLHVATEDHINCHRFCLHLWRPQSAEEMELLGQIYRSDLQGIESPGCIPLPPGFMVGPQPLTQGT